MSRYVIRNNVHYGTVDEMVNTIEAQAAEIERLAEDKRWIIDERDRTFALMLSRAEEAEAEIERLRGALAKLIGGSETVLEAWDHHMRDVVVPGSLHDAIEELRADVAEAKGGKDAQGNM